MTGEPSEKTLLGVERGTEVSEGSMKGGRQFSMRSPVQIVEAVLKSGEALKKAPDSRPEGKPCCDYRRSNPLFTVGASGEAYGSGWREERSELPFSEIAWETGGMNPQSFCGVYSQNSGRSPQGCLPFSQIGLRS